MLIAARHRGPMHRVRASAVHHLSNRSSDISIPPLVRAPEDVACAEVQAAPRSDHGLVPPTATAQSLPAFFLHSDGPKAFPQPSPMESLRAISGSPKKVHQSRGVLASGVTNWRVAEPALFPEHLRAANSQQALLHIRKPARTTSCLRATSGGLAWAATAVHPQIRPANSGLMVAHVHLPEATHAVLFCHRCELSVRDLWKTRR